MFQQQCRMIQQKQILKQQQLQGQNAVPPSAFPSDVISVNNESFNFKSPNAMPLSQSIPHLQSELSNLSTQNSTSSINGAISKQSNFNFNDNELQNLLSQRTEVTASIAENLIAQFSIDAKEPSSQQANNTASSAPTSISSEKVSQTTMCSESSNDTIIKSNDHTSSLSFASSSSSSSHQNPKLHIRMLSSEVIQACKGLGRSGHIVSSLLFDDGRPPLPPDPPYPPIPREKLLPPTPSVFVSCFCNQYLRFIIYLSFIFNSLKIKKMLSHCNCKNFVSHIQLQSSEA